VSARHENTFENFVNASVSMSSLPDLCRLMTETLSDLGFDRVNCSIKRAPLLPKSVQRFGIINTYPHLWQNRYREMGFGQIDPVLQCATGHNSPFTWSQLLNELPLSRLQRTMFYEAQEAGLYNGIGLPFVGPGTQIGGIAMATSFKSARGLPSLDLMSAYSNQFFVTFKRLAGAAPIRCSLARPLSLRESELLMWLATGKSDRDIGELMSISHNTVNGYLRKIFEKLEVHDRTSAVARAVKFGIIDAE